jgi:phosphate transport system protein
MGNSNFDVELDEISRSVLRMFDLVRSAIPLATDALVNDDVATARAVIDSDRTVDMLYARIEDQIQRCFTLQAPLGAEMRYLLSMLRVVPEMERTGDLVGHIAARASRQVGSCMTPTLRHLVVEMGAVAEVLWLGAQVTYERRDPFLADRLRVRDDQLDDLHAVFLAELVQAGLSIPVSVELAFVARFYERIGDHAVNVANRIRYVSLGVGVLEHPGRKDSIR